MMPVDSGLAMLSLWICNGCNKIAIKWLATLFTIFCRFFSKNDSALTMLFYSFIKIPAPEILPQ
jgi:hypothetical protein